MLMYFGDLKTAALSFMSFGEITVVKLLLMGFQEGFRAPLRLLFGVLPYGRLLLSIDGLRP